MAQRSQAILTSILSVDLCTVVTVVFPRVTYKILKGYLPLYDHLYIAILEYIWTTNCKIKKKK